MSKKNENKKKKRSVGKIILIVLAVIIVAVVAIWFAIPSGMRNMLMLMALPGESYDDYQEYQVIDRNEDALAPSAFEPTAAVSGETDENTNIAVVTGMLLNENSSMLKDAEMQTIGPDDYTGWHILADEIAANGEYPYGPSPLSYYTTGIAANLHTQVVKAAEVQGVELDDVKVEVMNTFRWNEMISDDGTGHLDVTTTNIIIESDASEEEVQSVIDMAINAWAAGEALRNETVIEPALIVNGENWDIYGAAPGTSPSEVSVVGDLTMSRVTDEPRYPEYIELPSQQEDAGFSLSFDAITNMEFEIFAIAESAATSERPYLKQVTLSTPSEGTWVVYSDEFMYEGDTPLAPTSLEYFTVGTALCLTSQTTIVSSMMDLEFTDYRVENQTDYRQENVGTTDMASYLDTVHSYIIIESDESQERLEAFFNKSLSLCFAGEGLSQETEMVTSVYLNGSELK